MPFPNVPPYNTYPTADRALIEVKMAQLAMTGVELDLTSGSDRPATIVVAAEVVEASVERDQVTADQLLALQLMQLGGFSNASVDAAKAVLEGDQASTQQLGVALGWASQQGGAK